MLDFFKGCGSIPDQAGVINDGPDEEATVHHPNDEETVYAEHLAVFLEHHQAFKEEAQKHTVHCDCIPYLELNEVGGESVIGVFVFKV